MGNLKNNNFLYFTRIIFFILFYGLLFALLSYYTLVSLSEIQQDILNFLKSLIYSEEDRLGMGAKLVLGLKILNVFLFFLLTLFSFSMFSSGLTGFFYVTSAKKHGYEKIDLPLALKKVTEWQLYKYPLIFLPVLKFILAAGVLFIIAVVLFNSIVAGIGVITGLSFLVLSFIGFNLMFFLSLAILVTLWKVINLSFGTEIAISEPGLDNQTISLRSRRIITAARSNALLLFVYLVFGFLLLVQLKNLDILNAQVFSIFFSFNALTYAGVKYLKTNAYIKSLLNYYEKAKSLAV